MDRVIGIVDEQPDLVAALGDAFSSAGFRPEGASSFQEGLRMMSRCDPAILVVSVELGAFNGLHLLMRAAVEHPSTQVVVMGPAGRGLREEALALGASAYLPRPITPEAVVERVRDLPHPFRPRVLKYVS